MARAKKTQARQNQKRENAASYWNDLLKKEFTKETDRGAVILASTLLDVGLDSLLRSYLVPIASASDELFDGANAPLNNFSAKINLSYRLGLVSEKYARDLHLIRRIRNEFAHNIHGCEFGHSSVKARVLELHKSFSVAKNLTQEQRRKMFPEGTRGDFLMVTSWLLFALHNKNEEIANLSSCRPEWGYMDKQVELEKKKDEDPDKGITAANKSIATSGSGH